MVLAFQHPRLTHPTMETDLAEMGGSQQALEHGEQAFVKDMFTSELPTLHWLSIGTTSGRQALGLPPLGGGGVA